MNLRSAIAFSGLLTRIPVRPPGSGRRWGILAVVLFGLLVPALAQAQVLIIEQHRRIVLPRPNPRPTPVPSAYCIRSVDVQAAIKDQAAKVQISQVFRNTGSATLEAQFMFPMPENVAISGLTLLVDGRELAGRLLKKDEARHIYEEIVRRQRDPALLEYMGQGMFQTSVFPIPAQAERTVEIRYTQLLKKENGLIDFLLPIGSTKHSNKPVETLNVTVRVEAGDQIKTVYSPTHQLEIQRPDNSHALCKMSLRDAYSPDDFRLLYGTVNGLVGMNVISYRPSESEDGYFVLLASPEVKSALAERVEKTMVFAFDKSGSMSGKKIEQAKEALKFLINQLKPGDTFNVIAYDSAVESFRPELQRADEATIKAALSFADGLYAGGSTNIDGALQTALKMLNDPKRPSYVLFMTDGLPTVGEMHELKIAANAKQANVVNARVFAFGVGFDVNSRLLDRLSGEHRGQSVYVRPNENIEAHVSNLYTKIGSPLLTDLAVNMEFDKVIPAGSASPISRTYPRRLTDLFQGEQLVWVGRYKYGGPVKVSLTGSVAGEHRTFTFPATLAERSPDETNGFVEKLWATRRIGEIIDELDLKGHNQELVDEMVHLSIRHGIITPYTAFLADERVNLADRESNVRRGLSLARSGLDKAEGKAGVEQRDYKARLKESASGPAGVPGMAMGGAMSAKKAGRGASKPADPESMRRLTAAKGQAAVTQNLEGEVEVLESVRNVGQKTYFRRGQQWQDSTVTPEQAKNAIRVTQYSPAYFELAAAHGGALAKYIAFDEPVLVNLGPKTYQIDPPPPEEGATDKPQDK
ncbi:MAG: VWA domain-containing protein [Planctomycetia bacterium]|nr:VWA domain-containing protein [Planctomycetia bacterium]